ncbi:hypothetical protein ACLOJK_001596 [Asimina triloba]
MVDLCGVFSRCVKREGAALRQSDSDPLVGIGRFWGLGLGHALLRRECQPWSKEKGLILVGANLHHLSPANMTFQDFSLNLRKRRVYGDHGGLSAKVKGGEAMEALVVSPLRMAQLGPESTDAARGWSPRFEHNRASKERGRIRKPLKDFNMEPKAREILTKFMSMCSKVISRNAAMGIITPLNKEDMTQAEVMVRDHLPDQWKKLKALEDQVHQVELHPRESTYGHFIQEEEASYQFFNPESKDPFGNDPLLTQKERLSIAVMSKRQSRLLYLNILLPESSLK